MALQHSTDMLNKLSCRPKRATALTSCFKNNFSVAGSSLCMQQPRGPDPNTPQDLKVLLALGKSATPLSMESCLLREEHGPPAEKERWRTQIKTAPQHNPQELGSLSTSYTHLQVSCKRQERLQTRTIQTDFE